MSELREIARAAWAEARNCGYLKWCEDCEGAHLLDRYALTQYLEEEFNSWPLVEKWEKIGNEFAKTEALLHASGLVNVHGHIVETKNGHILICEECQRERECPSEF